METMTTERYVVRPLRDDDAFGECYACLYSEGTVHGSDTLYHVAADGEWSAFCDHCWRRGPQHAARKARDTARFFREPERELPNCPPIPAAVPRTPEEKAAFSARMAAEFDRRAEALERLDAWPGPSIVSCTRCPRRYDEREMWVAEPVGPTSEAPTLTLPPTFICPKCREQGPQELAHYWRFRAECLDDDAAEYRLQADLVAAATW